jgi:hypothetical protein
LPPGRGSHARAEAMCVGALATGRLVGLFAHERSILKLLNPQREGLRRDKYKNLSGEWQLGLLFRGLSDHHSSMAAHCDRGFLMSKQSGHSFPEHSYPWTSLLPEQNQDIEPCLASLAPVGALSFPQSYDLQACNPLQVLSK